MLLSFWAALLFCVAYATAGYFVLGLGYDQSTANSAILVFVYQYGGLIAGTACASLFLMSTLVLGAVPALIEQALPDSTTEQTDYRFWKERLQSGRLSVALLPLISQTTSMSRSSSGEFGLTAVPRRNDP